jgi:hypothetical protein
MRSEPIVVADPAAGEIVVAGVRTAMSPPDASGAIRFGGADGTTLHPLTFSQRTSVVTAASSHGRATDAVAAAVLAASRPDGGAGDRTLLEVLALWLAGAEWEAPNFAETALLVARGAGWQPHHLLGAPATEVDRLAVYLDQQERSGDWHKLLFALEPAETLDAVRVRFAERLLRRSALVAAMAADAPMAKESRSETAASSDDSTSHPPLRGTVSPSAGRAGVDTGAPRGNEKSTLPLAPRSGERTDESPSPVSGAGGAKVLRIEEHRPTAAAIDRAESGRAAEPTSHEQEPADLSTAALTRDGRFAASRPPAAGPGLVTANREPRTVTPAVITANRETPAANPKLATGNTPSQAASAEPYAPPALFAIATGFGASRLSSRASQSAAFAEARVAPLTETAALTRESFDVVRALATLLDDEADLRGLDR